SQIMRFWTYRWFRRWFLLAARSASECPLWVNGQGPRLEFGTSRAVLPGLVYYQADRLGLSLAVVADQLDEAVRMGCLAGLDLGQHVLDGPRLEQRKLPHGPVMIVRIGLAHVLDCRDEALVQQALDLPGQLVFVRLGEIGVQLDVLRSGEDPAPARSRRSTSSNSNLVSFHSASASRSSGECRAAAARICGPSAARSWPSPRARTTASRATRTAVAPALLPCGCPWVPPPNWSTQSMPKISTSSGMCPT